MAETFELKKISSDALEQALAKAKQYRVLEQPQQAESLCLDILAVDPDHQEALVVMVLALTDQFRRGGSGVIRRAKKYLAQMEHEYDKLYYSGIISEREGRAMLDRGAARGFAYECFREAMDLYEKAEAIRPEKNDDAILRWNSCARTIMNEKLVPPEKENVRLLE